MQTFQEFSYARQADHYSFNEQELHTRFELNSIDRWRHQRMYDTVKPLIRPNDSWLTIGDGRFGSDAIFLSRMGVSRILPTDLSETLLRIGKERGLIADYRVENAEHLSFANASFDWVFCKEAYHHFPRPYLAVYEMLRVARKGVIFIEPTDRQIESRYAAGIAHGWQFFVRTAADALKRRLGKQPWQPEVHYESAGNYVYTVSPREMEKVCLGLNLPWLATRGMCDHYEPGYETELAEEGASAGSGNKFVALRSRLRKAEDRARRGLGAWGLHTVVLGVAELEGDVERGLRQRGFEVKRLKRNPWVALKQAQ